MNQNDKSTFGSVLLGIMIAILVILLTILAYFIYNNSVNSADRFGTDVYHQVHYSQAVKSSGKTYLNVKWPFFTDDSWEYQSLDYNGEQYVVGNCKVTAEGNPEKIDVICVFQMKGRTVMTAFFAAGDKIYYDGINYTNYLINEALEDSNSGIRWNLTTTSPAMGNN